MSSEAPDETPTQRRRLGIWLLLVVVVLLLVFLLWRQQPGEGSPASSEPSTTGQAAGAAADPEDSAARDEAIEESLGALSTAWEKRDEDAFVVAAGATSAAKSWASRTYQNLEELDIAEIEADLVGEREGGIRSDGTFMVDVDIRWTPGPDSGLAETQTGAVRVGAELRPTDEGFSLEAVTPSDTPMPLWLADELTIERHGPATIVSVGAAGKSRELGLAAARATRKVRQIVPGAGKRTVVVVPETKEIAEQFVGDGSIDNLTALTMTIDGSESPDAATMVMTHPGMSGEIDRRVDQIVLTHEITHDLTGAVGVPMPRWVSEGFADYVGFKNVKLPPEKIAARALRHVRQSGPPRQLPVDDDFDPARPAVGAAYEASWMAFRMLAERFGEEAVVGFYADARDGMTVSDALRRNFDLTTYVFVREWRSELALYARR